MRRASPSLFLGLLALTAPHCGGSTTAELGARCASPSDCAPGLECIDRTCRLRAAGDAGTGGGSAGTGGAAASTGGAGTGGAPDAGSDGGSLPCDGDAASCLCQSIATTCAPEESFEWLPLGSRGYRICADAGDGCVVRHFQETEGGVAMFRCYAPHDLPCSGDPWSVIQSMTCSLVGSCNVLLGDCPSDLLDCSLAPAPL
jgi:hypothetical protein